MQAVIVHLKLQKILVWSTVCNFAKMSLIHIRVA